ncbi:AAA family ATPase [Chloroflexota bacterium]
MNENYKNHVYSLLTDLKRIELKLQLQLERVRTESRRAGDNKSHALYISENEIDAILHSPLRTSVKDIPLPGKTDESTPSESIKQNSANTDEIDTNSLHQEQLLRLQALKSSFQLSAFEIDALLVCILPELDLKYQRLYGYLQDDITKKSPTVDLLLHLLYESFEQRATARKAFLSEAPLIKYHLLRLRDDHTSGNAPLLAKSLQIDERITGHLLGVEQIDARIMPFTCLAQPGHGLQEVVVPDDTKRRLAGLASRFKNEGLVSYFRGESGVGKQATAEAICYELGVPLLIVDVNCMVTANISPELSVPLIFREGLLENAALYLNAFDMLLTDENEVKQGYNAVINELSSYPDWVFLSGEKAWEPGSSLQNKRFVSVELTMPSYPARRQLWEKYWNGHAQLDADVDLTDLSGKFRISGGQIRDAVAMARNLALWRDPEQGLVTTDDLYSACRQQSRHKLDTLAYKISPKYKWDDIVLPKDQVEQLREICFYFKHHHTVYGDWGFDRKLSLGKGLNVLFAGSSGTGKTMAAEIIATELGLDLYKIDLSAIVSKYIGETEKNLGRIFHEGQTSNAILFFDEADALFGKRSEVRDSHDRYANIEIAYLLQKMDEYEGVVILATNLRKNMDDAFARRMHFSVEFPVPDVSDRYRIWQTMFPTEAPLTKDIDFRFMAGQFKITGGNIKNIALSAAFLAAEDGGCIDIKNLIRATKREYQKMGKLCTEGEFGQYFELVK